MKKLVGIIVLIIISIILSGCNTAHTESKSMEQIYKEQGVPVKTKIVKPEKFEAQHRYYAHLSGIEESVAAALIGDKVEKILVKVGDYVKKDQVLVTFPTDNPNARYYQARVAFEHAERVYKRMKNLFESGGISQQELENAKTQYEVSKADWDAVSQAVKVKSPISGFVTRINVRESDNVNPGDALVTVSQTRKLKAKIQIPEQHIADIKPNAPAEAHWMGKIIYGKIVQVDISMDPELQTFGAIAEFENPDNIFPGGITAEIIIKAYQNDAALVVQDKDLFQDNDSVFVWIAQNGYAKKIPVKKGYSTDMKSEIISGLEPGTPLIVEGQMLLEDGVKIRITN
ncbi:MAG: efflux RND transporter periplasmic adaptor subunit [Calditrichia bacterium]